MSVTKDGDTGRWMSQIRVTDWTGKTIHKKKRGFATKKEALQWERDFISQSTGSLGMTFGDFIALYVKDMEHRLKPSTVASKKWLIDLKVTPFFKKIPLNEIKPTHVRQWQNSLTSYRDENGKLCGDVDYESAEAVAGYLTPVPGGVGPMTITMLMKNAVTAAKIQNGLV